MLNSETVKSLVETKREVPAVRIRTPSLSAYDRLLSNPELLRRKDIANE